MILYSTILPTTNELTRDIFLKTVFEKTNRLQQDQLISGLPETGIKKISSPTTGKSLEIATCESKSLTALRYKRTDFSGCTLVREYVLDSQNKFLSIQTDIRNCTGKPDPSLIRRNIPMVIHRLIDRHLLAADSRLPISGHPIFMNPEGELNPTTIMTEMVSSQLPILFIAPSTLTSNSISVEKTAFLLAGLAHVVVIPFQKELKKRKTSGHNFPYPKRRLTLYSTGAKEFSTISFSGKSTDHYESLLLQTLEFRNNHIVSDIPSFDQIITCIQQEQLLHSETKCNAALISQKNTEMKYQQLLDHLEEEKQRINKEATEKALQEAEQIVTSYEEDILSLKEEIYEKNLTIQGIEIENNKLRSHLNRNRIPVLYYGEERDFYSDEIHDLILSTLEDALENVPEKSRKRDVIADILGSNNYMHTSKDRNKQIKNLLKGYDGMSAKIRHELEQLGFTIEETSKHCKICYYGDNRYLAVFGSTPSDVRAGKNNATILTRMAY